MEETEEQPLAQITALDELKRRYQIFDSQTLRRWAQAVTGTHREAMTAILREREAAAGQPPSDPAAGA